MRFMTIVKSRETTAQPSPALIDRINKLAEDAVKQGTFGGMGGLGPTRWARGPASQTGRSP
jgi:hypothetical protein